MGKDIIICIIIIRIIIIIIIGFSIIIIIIIIIIVDPHRVQIVFGDTSDTVREGSIKKLAFYPQKGDKGFPRHIWFGNISVLVT